MSTRSGNIEEMENGPRDSMGGNGEWGFFCFGFFWFYCCFVWLSWSGTLLFGFF